ncbi:hypothetical protein WA026_003660 [Henosepilachna vigintioctopunctata]|uniref:Small RNA 2'-O-methyltransferase n=1 Tax=Henosepilachna vigintioctopunctata TaxID=420089 RepID=A0AAW1U734_9CUCU
MILIFHGLSFLVRYLLGERKRRKAIKEYEKIQQIINEIDFAKSCAYINAEQNLAFDPPVYRQRYGIIHDILLNAKWRKDLKKVVEFGCAEFGLLIFLKSLLGITEINFVDIDEELLQENLYRVRPFTLEYLKRRSEPLTVNVWAGSITDPDKRILDCDVVIGIEIIEHLYPDVLEAVPYTIFNCIQPKLAIFTTPNADFNVLFPKFKGFRHYDHKFEWTREQFESWATNITDRFPQYFANFHGIGQGPEGTESLGCCSQMVVFIRKDVVNPSYVLPIVRCFCRGDMESNDKSQDSSKISNYCPSCCPPMISYGICTYFSYAKHFEALKTVSANTTDRGNLIFYKLLKTEEYPYTKDDRTSEQKIMDEIRCKITNLGYCYGNFFKEEKLRSEIPLNKLTCILDGQFVTIEEVQDILSRHGYKLEECFINEEDDEKRLCVIYEPEMENLSSTSPNGGVFPEWLLQMLRTNFPLEGEVTHDGPDFYCQGDGLGVHPSIIAVDIDDNEDASSESSSGTNGSAALVEVDNENTSHDTISLPDDNRLAVAEQYNSPQNAIPLHRAISTVENYPLSIHNEESEEYFDTTEDINPVPKTLI